MSSSRETLKSASACQFDMGAAEGGEKGQDGKTTHNGITASMVERNKGLWQPSKAAPAGKLDEARKPGFRENLTQGLQEARKSNPPPIHSWGVVFEGFRRIFEEF